METEKLGPVEKEYLLNRSFMGTYGMTPEMYSKIAREFRHKIERDKDETWLFDLSTIFDNRLNGIYLDAIHVSKRGNEIIAEEIADIMLRTINFVKGRIKIT
jgi:malate synthase